jgi:hypothetical protein
VISDSDLETLRAEARESVPDHLSDTPTVSGQESPATLAWIHRTAHLATLRAQAQGTATAGPLSSVSYLDRSKSFGGGAAFPAARTWEEALLQQTNPGKEYLSLVQPRSQITRAYTPTRGL